MHVSQYPFASRVFFAAPCTVHLALSALSPGTADSKSPLLCSHLRDPAVTGGQDHGTGIGPGFVLASENSIALIRV